MPGPDLKSNPAAHPRAGSGEQSGDRFALVPNAHGTATGGGELLFQGQPGRPTQGGVQVAPDRDEGQLPGQGSDLPRHGPKREWDAQEVVIR